MTMSQLILIDMDVQGQYRRPRPVGPASRIFTSRYIMLAIPCQDKNSTWRNDEMLWGTHCKPMPTRKYFVCHDPT